MSVRRKGRELALMALYSLDGVPTYERESALEGFWTLFHSKRVWETFFLPHPKEMHPTQNHPLWDLFDNLDLEPPAKSQLRLAKKFQNAKDFAVIRIKGVLDNLEQLDSVLVASSQGWRLQRMPQTDRNILRLGAFELLHCPDVPPPVVINEAIELSKSFSSRKSRSFVNGVLDRVKRGKGKQSSEPFVVVRRKRAPQPSKSNP